MTEKLVTEETMLKYFQSKSRDNARTPMQWDTSSNAGFSDTTPWLETNPNYQAINAKAALDNPDSIFYFYQKLIKLRHQLPVITDGTFKLLPDNEQDDHIFAYTRTNSETTLLIIANFTSDTITRNYDVPKAAQLLIQNYTDDQETTIRPYEVKVYQYPTKSLKK